MNAMQFVSDYAITLVFIVATFGFFLWWYLKDFRPAVLAFKQAAQKLPQEKAVARSEIRAQLKGTLLELAFKKYEQTLIQTDQGRAYTLNEAPLYFSLGAVFGPERMKRWQTYANIMLGLGILGTFVGLSVGLMGFDTSNPDKINQSIQTLVPGMQTAFWTSVAGMFTSLLSNFLQKWKLAKPVQRMEQFCHVLDETYLLSGERELELFYSFPNPLGQRVYPSGFMQQIMQDSEAQTRGIKRFTEDLAEGIILSSETMDLLADKIAHALEQPMTQHMIPALQDVKQAVQELRSEKQESIQEFISGVSNQFTESMDQIANKFESALTQSMQEKLAGLATAVAEAGASFSSLPALIETQLSSLRESSESMQQSFAEMMQTQTSQFESLVKRLTEELEQAIGSQQEALSQLLDQETIHFEQVMISLSEQLTQDIATQQAAISRFSENISEQTQKAALALSEVLQQIETQQATGAQALQEVITSTRQMLDSLQGSVENIGSAMGNMEGAMNDMQNLSQHMGSAATALSQTGVSLSEMTQSFFSQSDKVSAHNQELLVQILAAMENATNMTETYVEQFGTIKAGLAKIFVDINQGLTHYRDESRETLNRYLGDFTEHLSEAARQLSSSVSGMRTLVEDIEKVHQSLPDSVQGVEGLTHKLLQASQGIPLSVERFDEVRQGLERLLLQLPQMERMNETT